MTRKSFFVLNICLFLAVLAGCGQPASVTGIPSEMDFVLIPAGSFLMGSPSDEEGRFSDESPLHEVLISYSFEMLTTELTQGSWEEVMGTNPSSFQNPDRPVEFVSWADCQLFIDKLNLVDSNYFYRLPSEAEWEYACRAGTATRFYSGDDENDLEQIGWFNKNSGSTTEVCAQLAPNAWGLYDMSGNVWEWCTDYYHEDYTGAPTDGSAWIDIPTPNIVSRGGSIGSAARRCRSAARDACYPEFRYHFLGFRLVRTPL